MLAYVSLFSNRNAWKFPTPPCIGSRALASRGGTFSLSTTHHRFQHSALQRKDFFQIRNCGNQGSSKHHWWKISSASWTHGYQINYFRKDFHFSVFRFLPHNLLWQWTSVIVSMVKPDLETTFKNAEELVAGGCQRNVNVEPMCLAWMPKKMVACPSHPSICIFAHLVQSLGIENLPNEEKRVRLR